MAKKTVYVVSKAEVVASSGASTALLKIRLDGEDKSEKHEPLELDIRVPCGRAGAILDHLTSPYEP